MVNDVTVAAGILLFFIAAGVLMPFVYTELDFTSTSLEAQTITDEALEELKQTQTIGAMDVIQSILKMIFWLPNYIPFWVAILFYIMRTILVFIIARNLWIGGGG